MTSHPVRAIGLISGTSLDGIDVACVCLGGHGHGATCELEAFATVPYPPNVRAELLALYDDHADAVARLCSLNVVIGECFAEAVLQVASEHNIPLESVSVIGSHGQTVWHQPASDPAIPLSTPSTLQIGEAAIIAARTGCEVVSNFRVADMAVGGQGAPLVPYMDWAILGSATESRAVQNIGGIGNVTWLPAGSDQSAVTAFDTGPGNILIDGLVRTLTNNAAAYDRNGEIAASGTPDADLLAHLLSDPYLQQPPPKSTGREYYGARQVDAFLKHAKLEPGALAEGDTTARQTAANIVATATAFTAYAIADAYRRWLPTLPDRVLVNGGGARNPVLMAMLAEALPGIPVEPTDAIGIDADAKEAMAFALLAHDALAGLPTNIPGATGASRAVTLGTRTHLS